MNTMKDQKAYNLLNLVQRDPITIHSRQQRQTLEKKGILLKPRVNFLEEMRLDSTKARDGKGNYDP